MAPEPNRLPTTDVRGAYLVVRGSSVLLALSLDSLLNAGVLSFLRQAGRNVCISHPGPILSEAVFRSERGIERRLSLAAYCGL